MTTTHPLNSDPALRLLDSIDKHMLDILKVLKNHDEMLKEIQAAATSPEDRMLIRNWTEATDRLTERLESTRTRIHKTLTNVVVTIKVRTLLTWSWCARKVRSIHMPKRPHIRIRPRRESVVTPEAVAA